MNPLVGRHCGDVAAGETDAPRARRDTSADKADERRLSGAVGSDDRADLALFDRQVDILDGFQPAEAASEAIRGEQRRHGSHGSHLSRMVPMRPFGKNRMSTMSATPTTSR